MDMQGRVATEGLRCVFDDEVRALNSIVSGDIFSGRGSGWTTPGKPGFVDIGFQFSHAGGGCALMNNARPLRYHVEKHGALVVVHCGSLESFGLDGFAILAGAEDEIGQAEAEDGLFFLRFVEGVEEGEGFVAFRAERANGFSVAGEESWLRAGESGCEDATVASDRDVEG